METKKLIGATIVVGVVGTLTVMGTLCAVDMGSDIASELPDRIERWVEPPPTRRPLPSFRNSGPAPDPGGPITCPPGYRSEKSGRAWICSR